MKKLFSWIIRLSLILCLTPAVGAVEEEPLEFWIGEDNYPLTQDAAGAGWSYDAQGLTLTLSGLNLEDDTVDFGSAPEGFQIVLAPGSVSKIFELTTPYEDFSTPVSGEGELELTISNGSLLVNSGTVRGMMLQGDFLIKGGRFEASGVYSESLRIDGGKVILGWTKAASSVVINDGTLEIGELDTYALELNGGTVRAESMSNCNGTGLEHMRYALNGGELILENLDGDWSVFSCVADESSLADFRKELKVFEENMVDANGNPLIMKYFSYDEENEEYELSEAEADTCFDLVVGRLYNSDGTPARYAKSSCQHKSTVYQFDNESHWLVCENCDAVIQDSQSTHSHISFGAEQCCPCGHSYTAPVAQPVSAQAVELSLRTWLGLSSMSEAMQGIVDENGDGSIALQEVARLHLAAQGLEAPEKLAAVGMSYRSDRKALGALSAQKAPAGDWNWVKVYILDPETYAPLALPIQINH